MPCYEVAIEARKNDTAEKCIFSAWIYGENTPKAVEEALQKVAYEHPDFGMLRPVCVEEQKPVAACWQETSAPRRQWKIVHKYKVEYRSPVSNKELLKKILCVGSIRRRSCGLCKRECWNFGTYSECGGI